MNPVRKTLAPIDFSEDFANGLNYSVSLAQKTQAELIVLHVTQKNEADSFLASVISSSIRRRAF
jgi:Universal stress protein family